MRDNGTHDLKCGPTDVRHGGLWTRWRLLGSCRIGVEALRAMRSITWYDPCLIHCGVRKSRFHKVDLRGTVNWKLRGILRTELIVTDRQGVY